MEQYVGLDVSLKSVAVCILDAGGAPLFQGEVSSDPEVLIKLLRSNAPYAVRIGFETGPTSTWLWHTLKAAGLPVVCMDARQAHAALSVRPSKSDRNDARGLAEMVRMGWYREVKVKSLAAHERLALLGVRRQLVDMRVELDGQIRGICKLFGIMVGPGNADAFAKRAEAMTQHHPMLSVLVAKLLEVRRAATDQVVALDKQIKQLVRQDATVQRFMTVPGVGPVTALAFLSTVDDPARFARARDVGPYLGLTPSRYQSGETDRQGKISRCGDRFTRTCLYEAANVLLTKVTRWSPLKAWGQRLAQRIGLKKARIAVARKIAVILHCIWTDGTEFWWTKEAAMT